VGIVRAVLGDDVVGVYLYGSALHGGLQATSDLDLFAIIRRPMTPDERRALIGQLLPISGSRATAGPARSIELTIVVQSDVRPWRYPPRLDLQYGDWWRPEFERGDFEPWTTPDPDLAIVITTVLLASQPVYGPPAAEVLDPVPRDDLERAMLDGIPGVLLELEKDTRNMILTLSRMWMTMATGEIRPKDAAAGWVLERLPAEHRLVLERARAMYLGEAPEQWDDLLPRIRPHTDFVVGAIRDVAARRPAQP
jgi:predicted nucleotidyltransferase